MKGAHIFLEAKDLEVTSWDPFPSGGMRTGTIPNGIMVKHIPSGRSSISTSERSQHANKEKAIKQLEDLLASEGYYNE